MLVQISRLSRLSRFSTAITGAVGTRSDPVFVGVAADAFRNFSNNSSSGNKARNDKEASSSFRPRRKASRNYRPLKAGKDLKKKKDRAPNNDDKFVPNPRNELEATHGKLVAAKLLEMRQDKDKDPTFDTEEDLRLADYWTAEGGSTEEMVFERRAFAPDTPEERAKFYEDLQDAIKDGEKTYLDFEDETLHTYKKNPLAKKNEFAELFSEFDDDDDDADDDDRDKIFHNQLAFGDWSEMLIGVNRGIKLWRGGRLESYRALMIAGNFNGCGGFGIGKSTDPIKAVSLAGRNAKRNIFFVDRYQGDGLTQDLAGKMNSTKVIIRRTNRGLRGNPLCTEILARFGITNATSKAHGNRHPWNVVRATFKALMNHESIEEVALRRGKRLVSMDRALRMGI